MLPAYSTLPLTDLTLSRSHVTSATSMSPLTDPRSRPRAFRPFAVTLPLTLAAVRSPSAVMPVSETSPDTRLGVFELRRVGDRDVAADRLAAQRAVHAGHLHRPGHRVQVDRRRRRHHDGVVDRY